MARTISNTDDVIDSRDVIARIEELEPELRERHEAGEFQSDFDDWIKNSRDNSDPIYAAFPDDGHAVQSDIEEFYALTELADEAESSPDWVHGETLIRDSYFVDYIEELIDDCYELPAEMKSGDWPWRHIKVDYESAADDAKADYFEVDYDGESYWIRA